MFAQKLINLRKSRGLTQEQLALEIFVSRSMIAKYETGKAYPTNEILQRIADYFNVSVDELVQKEQLIDEHSKALENKLSTKEKLIKIVAIIGVLILMFVAVFSVVEIQVVESAVDYAQVVWNADFAQWQLYYYEQSNPNILKKRAFVHITEWDLYENSRTNAKFTIEGRDWFEQFNKHNISDDYRELKTVTLYYTVTTKRTLLGDVRDVNYKLIQVDFHLV